MWFRLSLLINIFLALHGKKRSATSLQDFLFGGRDVVLGIEHFSGMPWHDHSDCIQGSKHSLLYGNSFSNYGGGFPDTPAKQPSRWTPFFEISSPHLPYDEIAFSVDSMIPRPRPSRPSSTSLGRPHLVTEQSRPSTTYGSTHSMTSTSSNLPAATHSLTASAQHLLSRAPPADHFICPDQHSCSDEVWVTRDTSQSMLWQQRGCFCDQRCAEYNDCCRDADHFSADGSQVDRFSCRPVKPISGPEEPAASGSKSEERFYIRDSCPAQYDSYYGRLNCERPQRVDPMGWLPATSASSGITYRNLYCALCHNDTASLAVWPVSVHCAGVQGYQLQGELAEGLRVTADGVWGLQLRSGHITPCSLIPRPPRQPRPRTCLDTAPDCHRGSPTQLVKLCYNHTAVVYSGGRAFRNIYCLLCASSSRDLTPSCQPPCSATSLPASRGGLRARLHFPAGEDDRCSAMELWDPFTRQCRSLMCSRPGERLVRGRCSDVAEEDNDALDPDGADMLIANQPASSTEKISNITEPSSSTTNADSSSEATTTAAAEEVTTSSDSPSEDDKESRLVSLEPIVSEDVEADADSSDELREGSGTTSEQG